MGDIIAVIILVFLVFMGLAGYKKGFLKIVLSLAAMIVTVFLSMTLTPAMTSVLKNNTPIYDKIYVHMEDFVGAKIEDSAQPNDQSASLDALNLPDSLKGVIKDNNTGENYVEMGVNSFKSYTAASLTLMLLKAISFVIIFIIVSIVFAIIMKVADIFAKIPIIHGVNKIAGIVVGVLEGVLIIWVLAIIITACAGTAFGQKVLAVIDKNLLLSFFYNNNLLMQYVTKIF